MQRISSSSKHKSVLKLNKIKDSVEIFSSFIIIVVFAILFTSLRREPLQKVSLEKNSTKKNTVPPSAGCAGSGADSASGAGADSASAAGADSSCCCCFRHLRPLQPLPPPPRISLNLSLSPLAWSLTCLTLSLTCLALSTIFNKDETK